ncbi:Exodeoxyribonuclease VII small subunit [Friedmanniella luteola]|uniref:Exodeoxyribonuclease 7 small subunit n=1 Tax=Friedmanniella luteola TaxID=546871 RepID=A0A1H1NBJ6_9ACTN|nr:exodeoxyribonuclease VII small subunit [Friedmanniella luteola]SDR96220.1 Exodeoxyribonuclease VII small subunit [Friedmanniella luteola]
MSEAASRPEGDALTYEQAREELVQVVQRLESGGVPLDESLALWERGEHLAAVCQQRLDGARAKVDAARARTGTPG